MLPESAVPTSRSEALPEALRSGLEIVVARRLGDREDARDAVQEILARTLAAIRQNRIPPDLALDAYAYGIARHVIADALRRRTRERLRSGDVDRLRTDDPSPLDRLVRKEELAELCDALGELSPDDRRLLRRFYLEGVRIVDLARRLGVPPERLRKRKSRALRRLRAALGHSG